MIKLIASLCVMFCVYVTCSSDHDEMHASPVFISSTPEDGATKVSLETAIEVVFDEVVSLNTHYDITINDHVANVKASFTKLVFTEELQENSSYVIKISAGAVINTFNIPLAQQIIISFTTESNEVHIAENLVTKAPSLQAVNVYNFLKENYGVKSISSTMANGAWNINEAEWVKSHTGKYPAIASLDYIFLAWSPANWIDYSNIEFVKDWWANNGMISASWHWNVPPTPLEKDISKYTYKPESDNGITNTFKASNVPVDGTWENVVAKADLDKLIGYVKLLQDNDIPLIWRPLHEAAGNIFVYNNGKAWFWWGSDGAEAYKGLWRFMFDYFKSKGVNNLIWVWTTQTNDNAFYPGDEYVDLIGRDVYNNSDAIDIATQFKVIQKTYPNKMVTLSECGSVRNISEQWSNGAKWSYFMPWYDYERTNVINSQAFSSTDHIYANVNWWKDAINMDNVITRDKMPNLK